MSQRVADVPIEALLAVGVKRCYGIVGDTLNQIAHGKGRDVWEMILENIP
jgi:pyruvate dehydrogenase (quinone)